MYGMLLLLHILGATIWTGGHIVLALVVLPRALRERSPAVLLAHQLLPDVAGVSFRAGWFY